jgi:hypothetical protein
MEFCLLCSYGQEHEDWAGWAQFIGTLLAMGFAYHQGNKSEKQRKQSAFKTANIFATKINEILENLKEHCDACKEDLLQREAGVLQEMLIVGRSIPIDSLPEDAVIPFLDLLGIAAKGAEVCREISGPFAQNKAFVLVPQFERLCVSAHDTAIKLSGDV